MILLPCPLRPDLDCIAGSLAYAEYLQHTRNIEAKAWLSGTPDGEAQFYLDMFASKLIFADNADIQRAQSYILVDFSDIKHIPDKIDVDQVIEVIDHRDFTTPDKDFPNARIQIDKVGAAATQIAEYFMRDKLPPSPAIAAMLYGAIYSNTLCLKGQLCTERDRIAANWLAYIQPTANHYISAQLDARKQETVSQFPDILSLEMKIGNNRSGKFGISQLEISQGLEFWDTHRGAILAHFMQYDFPVYFNLIDLTTNTSLLYFVDPAFSKHLADHPNLTQINNQTAYFDPAQMRKQITPIINQI